MTNRRLSAVLLLTALVLPSCSSERDKPAGKGKSAQKDTAKASGKPVSKANQLVGRWVRDDDTVTEIQGIEFDKDGKAIIAMGDADSTVDLIADYAMMDGGRVRLTPAAGVNAITQVFKCRVDGSRLTLEPESEDLMLGMKQATTFRRLKDNESMKDAIKARAGATKK